VPEREFTKARILHALQALGEELTREGGARADLGLGMPTKEGF